MFQLFFSTFSSSQEPGFFAISRFVIIGTKVIAAKQCGLVFVYHQACPVLGKRLLALLNVVGPVTFSRMLDPLKMNSSLFISQLCSLGQVLTCERLVLRTRGQG